MTAIRSFAEILLEPDGLTPAEVQRFANVIHDESLRLTRLLDELLDLGRLERGELSMNPQTLDPEAPLGRALASCQALALQRGVVLERGARADAARVSADADRLCQVFINLLNNAINYGGSDAPRVDVSSVIDGGHYRVYVRDNGPGVDPDEAIFDAFTRGRRQRDGGTQGAGLGLPISRQIVTRLGGTLTLIDAGADAGVDVDATFIDLRDYPIPLYDGDLEAAEGLPENCLKLKTLFRAQHGMLIACPEYNGSITPLLKNTVDWLSRPHQGEPRLACFQDKVVTLLSASGGALGGLRGLVHVRALLSNIGCIVLPGQLAVGGADTAFDDSGSLADPQRREMFQQLAAATVNAAARLRS